MLQLTLLFVHYRPLRWLATVLMENERTMFKPNLIKSCTLYVILEQFNHNKATMNDRMPKVRLGTSRCC